MNQTRLKLEMIVAFVFLASVISANAGGYDPKYDWTVDIGGGSYGLVEWETGGDPLTSIFVGKRERKVKYPIAILVGAAAMVPALALILFLWRRRPAKSEI